MLMLIVVLTLFHLRISYNRVNNLLGRIQPVIALFSTQRCWQCLWCLAQLLILSAVFLPQSACKTLQELSNILSVMILRSLHFYWRAIYLWTNSLNEAKLFLRPLWNTVDKSIGILWFFERCLFPDHLGVVAVEDLPTMSVGSTMKSVNSSSERICFQQNYATSP